MKRSKLERCYYIQDSVVLYTTMFMCSKCKYGTMIMRECVIVEYARTRLAEELHLSPASETPSTNNMYVDSISLEL